MTAKTELPTVPAALVDVSMIDAPQCAAAAGISLSQWHELVRTGTAPAPAFREPRCTRWRLADVRAWLIQRASGNTYPGRTVALAQRASSVAKAKRQSAQAGA